MKKVEDGVDDISLQSFVKDFPPEHEKMLTGWDQNKNIILFLNWVGKRGYTISRPVEYSHQGERKINPAALEMLSVTRDKPLPLFLLSEYLGVDFNKLVEEKLSNEKQTSDVLQRFRTPIDPVSK